MNLPDRIDTPGNLLIGVAARRAGWALNIQAGVTLPNTSASAVRTT